MAADLAGVEASDEAVQADGGSLVVDLDDRAMEAVEVAGADRVVDPHVLADAEFGEDGRGADGVQEVVASVDGVGERGEVLIELAVGYRVKQRARGAAALDE